MDRLTNQSSMGRFVIGQADKAIICRFVIGQADKTATHREVCDWTG